MTRDEYKPNMPVFVEDIANTGCEHSLRISGITDGDYYQKPNNKMYYAIIRLDERSAKRLKSQTREYPLGRLQPIKVKGEG